MMIKDEYIKKYQELYKEHFGKDVSWVDASEQLRKLVRLVELTYKPMTKAEYEMVMKRRKELGLPEIRLEVDNERSI